MSDNKELAVFGGKIAVSVNDVAKACAIAPCTVYRALQRGELEGFRSAKPRGLSKFVSEICLDG